LGAFDLKKFNDLKKVTPIKLGPERQLTPINLVLAVIEKMIAF